MTWTDGRSSRFHHVWLRDNCPCTQCVHAVTREQIFELVSTAADNPAAAVAVDRSSSLVVEWSADGHRSTYHPGWLRAHRYDGDTRSERHHITPWDASTPDMPPTFDGPSILHDDEALYEWLIALRTFGLTRLRDVPLDPDAVGQVAARIGIVRETNFGVLWDVRSEPTPITNANTGLALPPHVDLATREYQPGLQLLHCIENEAEGGEGRYVDGFRLAEILRDEHPDHYRTLTTVPWAWANRSQVSDYRWTATPLVTDRDGAVTEVRVGNWLRAPLAVDFADVEPAYAAYRVLFELTRHDDLTIGWPLTPGDLLAFDNRRILHGRDAFSEGGGRRWLRGCYADRDELNSRIRILERARRAARITPKDAVDERD